MVVVSMSTCSRVTSSLKGFSLKFSYFNQPRIVQGSLRGIYTHTRGTGIQIFEENIKLISSQGPRLPSYIQSSPDISQTEMEDMYKAFEKIVQDLTSWPTTAKFARGNQRTRELLEYVTPWSPTIAAQTMMADRFHARRRRLGNKVVSEEDEKVRYQRAHQLAWCLELITRPATMNDDIMDGSDKRNGLPCWNTLPHIGLGAVNDSAIMAQGGYCLLHKYFGHEDFYSHLLKQVYDCMLVTEVAENELKLLNLTFQEGALDCKLLEHFMYVKGRLNGTLSKTCIIGAMLINGIRDLELARQVSEISFEAMNYGIMVDDYADCFGGEDVNQRQGGADLSQGSQTWLLFKALELSTPEQRQRLKINYGKNDPVSIQNVLQIYKELNIKEVVWNMAEETHGKVLDKINQLDGNEIPCNIFIGVIDHYRCAGQGTVARP